MSKKYWLSAEARREHAIIKRLKKSPDCGEVWCAPGNGGIGYDAKCKNIKGHRCGGHGGLLRRRKKFDYVVVAPDDPLALGMVDALAKVGIPAFGPTRRLPASRPPRSSPKT